MCCLYPTKYTFLELKLLREDCYCSVQNFHLRKHPRPVTFSLVPISKHLKLLTKILLTWASADFFQGEGKIFQGGPPVVINAKKCAKMREKCKKFKIYLSIIWALVQVCKGWMLGFEFILPIHFFSHRFLNLN